MAHVRVVPVPQQGESCWPQGWQVSPAGSVTQTVPPAVQIPGVPQQGSPCVPQEFPSNTQPLAVQVPPPRPPGHRLPSAMQIPLLLQQAPPAQELSGQQAPPACPQWVQVPGPVPVDVQPVSGS